MDDHAVLAETLSIYLGERGFDVRTAFNGAEALERAQGFAPDLALIDLGMPSMDGYELARRLLKILPVAPVLVAITGADDEDTARALWTHGFRKHMVKPVGLDDLAAVVEYELERLGR